MPAFTFPSKQSILRLSAWAVMVLLTVAACLYFFQEPFLSYPGGTVFLVSASTVHRGDDITLIVPRRCNSTGTKRDFKLVRSLARLDESVPKTDVVSIDSVIDAKTCDTARKSYHIPDDIHGGIYRIEGTAIVPGWFRKFYINYTSVPFEITE